MNGENMNLPNWIEPRLGPRPEDDEQFQRDASIKVDCLITELQRRKTMERVRAKFSVSNILKDQYGNTVVKL